PDRLPRYVLKCVVSRLARGGQGPLSRTPLFRLVDHAVRRLLGVPTYSLKEAYGALQSEFAPASEWPEIIDVLYQFLRHARPEKESDPSRRFLASLAISWLSGEEIDPEHAQALG